MFESTVVERPTVLVEDRLVRLGRVVPQVDLTWAPDSATAGEPLNAFLLRTDAEAVFIDTAPRLAEPELRAALAELVGDRRVSVFPTRNEPDCVGNLGLLLAVPSARLLFGGGGGILEWVSDPDDPVAGSFLGRTEIVPALNGTGWDGADGLRLRWMDAPVKQMFLTQWAYEASTRTLFSSDFFGWVHLPDETAGPVVGTIDTLPSSAQIELEIAQRFNWLPGATCPEVIEAYDATLAALDVDRIAPVHGCVVSGPDVVAELVARTRTALLALTAGDRRPA